MDIDYLKEFNLLRERKMQADLHVDLLKGLIREVMEAFPGGSPAGKDASLSSFLKQCREHNSAALSSVIQHPEICPENQVIGIPAALVHKALESVPREFYLYDYDGNPVVR